MQMPGSGKQMPCVPTGITACVRGTNRHNATITPVNMDNLEKPLNQQNKQQCAEEHAEMCSSLPVRKRCKKCYNKYKAEKYAQNKSNKVERTINTRRIANEKRSKYSHVLCDDCKDKTKKHLCRDCLVKYKRAKDKVYYYNVKERKMIEKQKNRENHINSIKSRCQVEKSTDNQCFKSIKINVRRKRSEVKTNIDLGSIHTANPSKQPFRNSKCQIVAEKDKNDQKKYTSNKKRKKM